MLAPSRSRLEAKVVSVQQVVGRYVVQLVGGGTVRTQQAADHESHHHSPNVAEELGDC